MTGRTPLEVLLAGLVKTEADLHLLRDGVCPACSGIVESTLHRCEDHDPDPVTGCAACGSRHEFGVRYTCSVCKRWDAAAVFVELLDHPAVVSFYHDHGVDVRVDPSEPDAYRDYWARLLAIEEHVVSRTPVRLLVTFPADAEDLHVTLDGERDVVEVSRTGGER